MWVKREAWDLLRQRVSEYATREASNQAVLWFRDEAVRKLKEENERLSSIEEANKLLREANERLSRENGSIQGYANSCCDLIGTRLPSIDTTSGNLLNLVAKLIAELDDARKYGPNGLVEAARLKPGEDLVDKIVDSTLVNEEILKLLGVGTMAEVVQRLKEMDELFRRTERLSKVLIDDIKPAREWLHAAPGESTVHAAQRVVLTLEVAHGAAEQVQKAREIVGAQGGETLLEALKRPRDFIISVKTRKGAVVGGQLKLVGEFPKVGDVELKTEEI